LEMTVALFAAIGSFIDSAQSFMASADDLKNGRGIFIAHILQAISFFVGGVAFSIYAVSIVFQGFGVSTSWLGWGIILVVIGLALGFVASLFMTHPMEDWVARSIWGNGIASKWSTKEMELLELNKVLLGIEVDAQFRSSLSVKNLTSVGDVIIGEAVRRMTAQESGAEFTREFVVKLKLVEQMRKRLGVHVHISGKGGSGAETIAVYSTDANGRPGENWGRGVSMGAIDHAALDALTISGHVESGRFSMLSVELTIRDALEDGDVIVQENMVIE